MKFIRLSFPLDVTDPRPPAIPAPSLEPLYTIERDGANVQTLRLASHTGTHLDAPRHVIADGMTLHDFAAEEFIFTRPVAVDLPMGEAEIVGSEALKPLVGKLKDADLGLFRFGYGKVRREQPGKYVDRCPGFGVEGARYLREQCPSLRAIGMDVPSVACIAHLAQTMTCHHELLGGANRRFLIIEDMNLDHDLRGLREVRINPWLVRGMDSGPCSAIGVLA
jgi:arylformamidase